MDLLLCFNKCFDYLTKYAVSAHQAAAYASDTSVLTEKMIDEKVAMAMKAREKKVLWQQTQGTSDMAMSPKQISMFSHPLPIKN